MQIFVGISDPLFPGCWYTHATYNSDSYRLLMGQPLHISEYHLCMVLKGVPQQYRQFRYASIVNSLSLLLAHWPRRHAPPAVSPPTISKTGHLQIEEDHQNDGCMVIGSLPINHPGKCSILRLLPRSSWTYQMVRCNASPFWSRTHTRRR